MVLQNSFDYFERFGVRKGIHLYNLCLSEIPICANYWNLMDRYIPGEDDRLTERFRN